MGHELVFFFDSYALVELYQGNKNYEKYKKARVITSYLHVYEVYHSLLRNNFSEEKINSFFQFLQHFCISLDFNWIPKAVNLRRNYKNRNLSYADCLGYIIAQEMSVKFLTGDKEFETLENVEFVKK